MYKVCIFDLDGTLADTIVSIAYCVNKALEQLGLTPHNVDSYNYFAGDGITPLLERSLLASGDIELVHFQELREVYIRIFAEHNMYEVTPYDGIVEMLGVLKEKNIKLAVLSNKPDAQAKNVVNTLFGEGCFDYIQGQKDTFPKKPDPAGAIRIAEILQVEKEECIYVGDTDTDMDTGNRAGMYTVGVTWGFRTREELEEHHADVIIEHPGELIDIVISDYP